MYIDIPAALEGEIRPNGATLDHVLRACRDGGSPRLWTDGLVTVSAAVVREALEAFWLLNNPSYGQVPAEWREGMRRAKPASVEDLSGLIDYSRCRQTGPVLAVGSDGWRFEEPAGRCQELPFLVALSDPHHYRLPLTGPYGTWGRAHERERKESIAAHTPPMRMGWRW
ncbi:hypothetical protein ACIQU4_18010 [Streptomyces sp. NPDC090741]|uniref:hypothetical protein n=1 Tax=Streptomyces sp. NPDC090741 TaxID=3365967 RepID=UPI00382F60D2